MACRASWRRVPSQGGFLKKNLCVSFEENQGPSSMESKHDDLLDTSFEGNTRYLLMIILDI